MHLHSFQDIELELNSYVSVVSEQVVHRLTILPYPRKGQE